MVHSSWPNQIRGLTRQSRSPTLSAEHSLPLFAATLLVLAPVVTTLSMRKRWCERAEGLLPLMTRPCDRIVDQPRLEGVELLTPSTDEELQGATAAQSEAFGGPPLSDANAELMHATIAAGGDRRSAHCATRPGGICGKCDHGVPHARPRRSGAGLRARGIRADVAHAAHRAFLMPGTSGGVRVRVPLSMPLPHPPSSPPAALASFRANLLGLRARDQGRLRLLSALRRRP